jgi:hypothetical protein
MIFIEFGLLTPQCCLTYCCHLLLKYDGNTTKFGLGVFCMILYIYFTIL